MTYGKRAVHAHKPIRSAGSIKEAVRLGAPAFRALNFHGSESKLVFSGSAGGERLPD